MQVLRLPLPERARRLRVQLDAEAGAIQLRRLCVKRGDDERCVRRDELFPLLRPLRDLEPLRLRPRAVRIVPSGDDPSFECDLTSLLPPWWRRPLALALIALVLPWADLLLRRSARLGAPLAAWLAWAADRRYRLAAALFVALVLLKLHGSSLAMWDLSLADKTPGYRPALLLGEPRLVRSDEWAIQTPLTLGQQHVSGAHFPLINPNIRSNGQHMLIHHVAPVLDATTIVRPFHWGYLLFGNERGLAWWWWSRLLLLFLLSYEMAVLLSGMTGAPALLAGAWITFAPVVQWGFSLCHTDLLIACQAMIVCAWSYVQAASFARRAWSAAGLGAGALAFVLALYPPQQIPLGYLALAVLALFAGQGRVWRRLERRDYVLLAALLLILATIAIVFLQGSLAELELLAQTVFPGQRRAQGGDVSPFELQRVLMSWRLPFAAPPYSNESELAGFMNLLPAVALVLPAALRRDPTRRALAWTLVGFTAATHAWLLVPFPGWLARLTLLDRVPTHRMQPMAELAGLYLTLWAVGVAARGPLVSAGRAVAIAACVALWQAASVLLSPMAGYIGGAWLLAPTLAFFAALNLALLLSRLRILWLGVFAYLVAAGFSVNPLARGLSPIYDKTVTRQAQAIAARDPGRLWAAKGRGYYANLLIATGLRTLNGSHVYPDLALWRRLDPEGRYEHVYNRHAMVALEVVDQGIAFELTEEPSGVTLRTDLRTLARLGVKYLLSVGAVSPQAGAPLRTLHHDPGDDIFLYEIGAAVGRE